MKQKYSDIRSFEDLDRAIAYNRDAIRRKESVLSRKYYRVKQYYSPVSLAGEGVRYLARNFPLSETILGFLGRFRRRK